MKLSALILSLILASPAAMASIPSKAYDIEIQELESLKNRGSESTINHLNSELKRLKMAAAPADEAELARRTGEIAAFKKHIQTEIGTYEAMAR